jgi:hypothetical protein
MIHAFPHRGWFDTSFESYIARIDEFRGKDGKRSRLAYEQQEPSGVNGILFDYMQLAFEKGGPEQFAAVGARYGELDVRCHSPVRIDMQLHAGGRSGFGPDVSTVEDECASRLLADLATRNPLLFEDLERIARAMGWLEQHPWSVGRARALT